jgi:hypothetical protein
MLMHTDRMRAPIRLLVLVAALALPAAAPADGDPASDVLVSQDIFTPYPAPSADARTSLANAVRTINVSGDRVKVAVIASRTDLGSVPSLFGKAQDYAKFLGIELSFIYKGPLLIVMPSGFGFSDAGRSVPAADAALVSASLSGGADGLTLSAAHVLPALEHAGVLHYRDTLAPQAYSSQATVIAGRRLALRYQAWDDSGRASVDLQVRNARQVVIAHFHVPLQTVRQGAWYWVVWRAPLTLAHRVVTSCVQATDPSGNHSRRTCSKVTIT